MGSARIVKAREELVQLGHELPGRQLRGARGERDEIAHQHGDVLVSIGYVRLASVQPRDDASGQHVQKKVA